MLRFFTLQGNGLMNKTLLGHRSRRVGEALLAFIRGGEALLTFSGGGKALLATGSIDETLHLHKVGLKTPGELLDLRRCRYSGGLP